MDNLLVHLSIRFAVSMEIRGWSLSILTCLMTDRAPWTAFWRIFAGSAMEKEIVSDRHIVAQVKGVTSVHSVSDDRTLKVCRISKD